MEPRSLMPSLVPLHIAQDLSQVRLALMDCARQLRYAARNVPGSESGAHRQATRSAGATPALPQFLGSVGQIADTLLETAETYAGQAIPPLQDHWKAPVDLDGDLERVIREAADTKVVRHCSSIYYAAAKRFILQAGANDVLIFEHRINDAFNSFCEAHDVVGALADTDVAPAFETLAHDVCRVYARLTLSLIDRHPIRSTRFDELPDVVAPWWLISEPNAYVFLLLGVAGCAKTSCPSALPGAPDEILRLAGDIVGAREARLRAALQSNDAGGAIQREFLHIIQYL